MAGTLRLLTSTLAVDPGSEIEAQLQVRNTGTVVDQFHFEVLGDAGGWATIEPTTVSLFPDAEEAVTVRFRPPRDGSVEAGPVPFAIKVASHEDPEFSLVEEGVVQVRSFVEIAAGIVPRTSHGRSKGVHRVPITNQGNEPLVARLTASDPDELLRFTIEPSVVTVTPRETREVKVTARAVRGGPKAQPRPFQVHVQPDGGSSPVVLDAAMQPQAGIGALWPKLAIAAAVLAALAVIASQTIFDDEVELTASPGAITTLPPTSVIQVGDTTPVTDPSSGSTDDDTPPNDDGAANDGDQAGTTDTTEPVGSTKVPDVAGQLTAEAIEKLRDEGFEVEVRWEAHPTLLKHRVVDTEPPAGAEVPSGSAVLVRLSLGKIVFMSDRAGNDDIWVMNADGSGQDNLTAGRAARDAHPAVSPDGAKIAFDSTEPEGSADIYVMNADGSDVRRLTNTSANNFSPSWSPDGTKLVFESGRDGNAEIYAMKADGSGTPVNLTRNELPDWGPAWSPDGTRIAWHRDGPDTGTSHIWVMNADANGSDKKRLTSKSDQRSLRPAWSPDGNKLSFVSNRDGDFDLYVMDADGSSPINVTRNNVEDRSISAWSPDGTTIAFTTYRDGTPRVYLTNLDGSVQTRLTEADSKDDWPAW